MTLLILFHSKRRYNNYRRNVFYFPYGIPLGEIVDFESNSQNGYYSINARLFEDPSLVNYVYVLSNEDRRNFKITRKFSK